MDVAPAPAPESAAAPARWWFAVAGAAACVLLYLGATVSAYLLTGMGDGTVPAAVVAIVVNVALCAAAIATDWP